MAPQAQGKRGQDREAPRLKTLEGKKIGVFWNMKPNGELFLVKVGQLLKERFPSVSIIDFLPGKPDMTRAAAPESIKKAVAGCDAVVLATGD
ncbi:MAG: hypothetical protein ABID87_08615 [Chloroflexota bacterium]